MLTFLFGDRLVEHERVDVILLEEHKKVLEGPTNGKKTKCTDVAIHPLAQSAGVQDAAGGGPGLILRVL
jgi:hypothetical protein